MNNITVFVIALFAISAVGTVGILYFNKKNNDSKPNEDE